MKDSTFGRPHPPQNLHPEFNSELRGNHFLTSGSWETFSFFFIFWQTFFCHYWFSNLRPLTPFTVWGTMQPRLENPQKRLENPQKHKWNKKGSKWKNLVLDGYGSDKPVRDTFSIGVYKCSSNTTSYLWFIYLFIFSVNLGFGLCLVF